MAETGTQTPVVELAAFEACDLNAPIAGVDQVGMPAISTAYGQASAAAASPAKDVYLLLSAVAGIHLRPSDPGNKFGPGAQRADLRTMIPSDIRGPQAEDPTPCDAGPRRRRRLDERSAQGGRGRNRHRRLLRLRRGSH